MAESHPIVIEGNQATNSKKDGANGGMSVNLRKTFNVIGHGSKNNNHNAANVS